VKTSALRRVSSAPVIAFLAGAVDEVCGQSHDRSVDRVDLRLAGETEIGIGCNGASPGPVLRFEEGDDAVDGQSRRADPGSPSVDGALPGRRRRRSGVRGPGVRRRELPRGNPGPRRGPDDSAATKRQVPSNRGSASEPSATQSCIASGTRIGIPPRPASSGETGQSPAGSAVSRSKAPVGVEWSPRRESSSARRSRRPRGTASWAGSPRSRCPCPSGAGRADPSGSG